jgi:hypothetical protein
VSGATTSAGRGFGATTSTVHLNADHVSGIAVMIFSAGSYSILDLRPTTIEDEAEAILRDRDFMTEVRAGLEDVDAGRLVSFEDVFGEPL